MEDFSQEITGMRVMNINRHLIGIIKSIDRNYIYVDFHGEISKYPYPSAFTKTLELEDENLQKKIKTISIEASFEDFKKTYSSALSREADYLRETGGKRYKLTDGEKILAKGSPLLYVFDTDTDLHFPEGTSVKMWFPERIIYGYIVSCEDFTITIRLSENVGNKIKSVEITSDQWHLTEVFNERLDEMHPDKNSIAFRIACMSKAQIAPFKKIEHGQNAAFHHATSEAITFIWGPPGTGKTEALACIAAEHINKGRRVLMLSYSNISVDGAILRVAEKSDFPGSSEGKIIRYGYPRMEKLLEDNTLVSYQYVLSCNPDKEKEYHDLLDKKKKLKKKDPERVKIKHKLNKIRAFYSDEEKKLVHTASFVATTVSKAAVDSSIYTQKFDVVMFDEASMAYVPQIVFSAGLAKSYFVCLGDFCQLPAIVQSKENDVLKKDIFDYTYITNAVNNNRGHDWLVMLDIQHRMHPEIAGFVSENMYHNLLKTYSKIIEKRKEIAKCKPYPGHAMSMVDLSDMYSVCQKTTDGSRINLMSALMALRLAEKNINNYEIGIITPYNAQSRLILSFIRDLQEDDERWKGVTCATVHQFQGSEKPVIIYDAVDCFRMPYPGMLLTSLENDNANRLFNVAITRSEGKFVVIANVDYLKRKHISKKLMFTKAIRHIENDDAVVKEGYVLDEVMPGNDEDPAIYIEDKEKSWDKFISDIKEAKKKIYIDIPDVIDEDEGHINKLKQMLSEKKREELDIRIRIPEDLDIPECFKGYEHVYKYAYNPVTIIDNNTIWFGQPLCAADFISEGEILETKYYPCIRFSVRHPSYAVKSLQAFLSM